MTSLKTTLTTVLEDYKAQAIQVLEAPPRLKAFLDHFIIGTATSNRHARTLADQVVRAAKSSGFRPLGVEGLETGEWILIDVGNIVVHIILSAQRDLYQLEALWAETSSKLLSKPGREIEEHRKITGEPA